METQGRRSTAPQEEAAGRKGDRCADADDVDDYSDQHELEGERIFCGVRELNYDPVHEEIHSDAVERAKNERMLEERGDRAADKDVNSRGRKRNEEVTE